MNREEALTILKKKMYEEADEITIEHLDGSQCMRTINIDLEMKEAIKVLERPITLAEILEWEEGVEYKANCELYKIENDTLKIRYGKRWVDDYELHLNNYDSLIGAKKVEPKLKAYHVTDEYSFNCLMKELDGQDYVWRDGGRLTEECELNFSNFIFKENGKIITKDTFLNEVCEFDEEYGDEYDLIEYHKEPPRFYAKIKGWELTDDTDCYWHKDENPIHGIYPWSEEEASIYTKEEWAKLGITDENADFEVIK